MFGTNMDINEAKKLSLNSLKLCKVAIDALVQSNDLVSIDNTKADYVNVIKQSLLNLEELQRYNESIKNMDVSIFENVVNYNDDDLAVRLNNFVAKYVNLDSLKQKEGPPGIDKFNVLYALEKTFKHKDEISCILCLKSGLIASGSFDSSIKIWEPETCKCRRVLDGHTHAILCIIEREN
jgi:WD40 repeat protein